MAKLSVASNGSRGRCSSWKVELESLVQATSKKMAWWFTWFMVIYSLSKHGNGKTEVSSCEKKIALMDFRLPRLTSGQWWCPAALLGGSFKKPRDIRHQRPLGVSARCCTANEMPWKNQCTNDRVNDWMSEWMNHSMNQWNNECINERINSSTNQWINQRMIWFSDLTHEWGNQRMSETTCIDTIQKKTCWNCRDGAPDSYTSYASHFGWRLSDHFGAPFRCPIEWVLQPWSFEGLRESEWFFSSFSPQTSPVPCNTTGIQSSTSFFELGVNCWKGGF